MDEIPFGRQAEQLLNNSIKSVGKHIARDFLSNLKVMLSGSTEIFFRKDLAERHFNSGAGTVLWLLTTLCSCFFGTLVPVILDRTRFYNLAGPFRGFLIPVIISLGVFILYSRLVKENNRRIGQIRATKQLLHSRSPGVPRWQETRFTLVLRVVILVLLVILAPVTGVAFIVSMNMSSKRAAEQQAAIRARYWDMVDAQLEGQFLQDAIEGKCEPNLVYLYKPLSEPDPDLKADIAAAAVGKPVRIVAKGPKATVAQTPTEKSAAESPLSQSRPPSPEQQPSEPTFKAETTHSSVNRSQFSKRAWMIFYAVALLVSLVVAAKKRFKKDDAPHASVAASQASPYFATPTANKFVEKTETPTPPKQAAPQSITTSTPTEAVQRSENSVRPKHTLDSLTTTNVPSSVAGSSPRTNTPKEIAQATGTPRAESQPLVETANAASPAEVQKITQQIQTIIREEFTRISEFQTNCDKILANKMSKISSWRRNAKSAFEKESGVARDGAVEIAKSEQAVLEKWQQDLPSLVSASGTGLQERLIKVNDYVEQMAKQRREFIAFVEGLSAPRASKSIFKSF